MSLFYRRRLLRGAGSGMDGSGTGGAPPDPGDGGGTPGFPTIAARQSDSIVDSFGINTHFAYGTSAGEYIYRNAGSYASADAAVVAALRYLGVRHVRETLAYGSGTMRTRLPAIAAAANVTALICAAAVQVTTKPTAAQAIAEIDTYYQTFCDGVEGYNEPDPAGTARVRPADWGQQTADFQQDLWNAGHARYRILSPSMGGQTYSGSAWPGDLGAWCDTASVHCYAGGQQPTNNMDQHLSRYQQLAGAGKKAWITEGGYHNALSSTNTGNMPVPEDVAGKYLPRNLLELLNRGVERFYRYELGDDKREDAQQNLERHYGMFAWDAGVSPTWRAKPEATAMRNMLALCSDPGSTFTPAPLPATVTGGGTTFRQLLTQKRDGTWLLWMWRNVSIWTPQASPGSGSPVAVTPTTITVAFDRPRTTRIYRPSTSAAGSSPVTGTSATVSVAGEAVCLTIV